MASKEQANGVLEGPDMSYADFLNAIKNMNFDQSGSDSFKKTKTTHEVYEELCLDFPLVEKDELKMLFEDFLQQVNNLINQILYEEEPSKTVLKLKYPISRGFLNGITYGARKKTDETEYYRSLCCIVSYNDRSPSHLESLLQDYNIPSDEESTSTDIFSFVSNLASKVLILHSLLTVQYKDDFIGASDSDDEETIETQITNTTQPAQDPITKLQDMISLISSDILYVPQNQWEAFALTRDITDIFATLPNHSMLASNTTYVEEIMFIYATVLRDRMLASPNEMINLLAILYEKILKITPKQQDDSPLQEYRNKLGISLLSAVLPSPEGTPKSLQQGLVLHIFQYLPFFGSRLSSLVNKPFGNDEFNETATVVSILGYLVASSNATTSNQVEDSLLKSGIIRDLSQILLKHGSRDEMKSARSFLILSSLKLPQVANYLKLVPEFPSFSRSDFIATKLPAEFILWCLVWNDKTEEEQAHQGTAQSKLQHLVGDTSQWDWKDMIHSVDWNGRISTLQEVAEGVYTLKGTAHGNKVIGDKSHWVQCLRNLHGYIRIPPVEENPKEGVPLNAVDEEEKIRERLNKLKVFTKKLFQEGGKSD